MVDVVFTVQPFDLFVFQERLENILTKDLNFKSPSKIITFPACSGPNVTPKTICMCEDRHIWYCSISDVHTTHTVCRKCQKPCKYYAARRFTICGVVSDFADCEGDGTEICFRDFCHPNIHDSFSDPVKYYDFVKV